MSHLPLCEQLLTVVGGEFNMDPRSSSGVGENDLAEVILLLLLTLSLLSEEGAKILIEFRISIMCVAIRVV